MLLPGRLITSAIISRPSDEIFYSILPSGECLFLLIYFNLHITQIHYRCLQRCPGVICPLTANNKLFLSYITFPRKPLTWLEKYWGQLSHMALVALWEPTWVLLQDSDSMRNPGSNGVARVLEVVIIKDLLVKDPLGSLYYFNNGSSQLYCFQRSLLAQKRKGSWQGNAGRRSAAHGFVQWGATGCWWHSFGDSGRFCVLPTSLLSVSLDGAM